MQPQYSHEKNVCLSDRPSVTKRKKLLLPTFLYHMTDRSPSFPTRRMIGGGRPFLPVILGQTDQPPFENAHFQMI